MTLQYLPAVQRHRYLYWTRRYSICQPYSAIETSIGHDATVSASRTAPSRPLLDMTLQYLPAVQRHRDLYWTRRYSICQPYSAIETSIAHDATVSASRTAPSRPLLDTTLQYLPAVQRHRDLYWTRRYSICQPYSAIETSIGHDATVSASRTAPSIPLLEMTLQYLPAVQRHRYLYWR